ncbi:LXG domain-containing protein [Amphibacillus cookii]|uniref:LXG domain-containing protein n=1 Tax=Amphibacillus cookii TaxID=767787 RepID=UPI001957F51F|nr:LXG domain-containing protein [Amphibacillus cookii]MBM7543014.1 hypothetical protein [Amphibacillus cookii]
MKVIEVKTLTAKLNMTNKSCQTCSEQLDAVKSALTNFLSLEDALKGQTGEAIRTYFNDFQFPLLKYLQNLLEDYRGVIDQIEQAISAYEPQDDGYLKEGYITQNLNNDLSQLEDITIALVDEVNQEINQVRDIIGLSQVDDHPFLQELQTGHQYLNEVVEDLHLLDKEQTNKIDEVNQDLISIDTYIEQLNKNFSIQSLQLYSNRIVAPMNNLYTWLHPTYYEGMNQLHSQLDPEFEQNVEKKDVESQDFIIGGDTAEITESASVTGGAGWYNNDWVGLDGFSTGDGQIGGTSEASLLHASGELDTDWVNAQVNQDILYGNATAQFGGESLFGLNLPLPLVKAEAKGYQLGGRAQVDRNIPYIGPVLGGTGGEAKGSAGNAQAYAGFDEKSVGVAAKASVVEGEVSGIFGIPFTDVDVKLTLGASLGSAGGEAKIGKETVLDLRALVGAKIGLSFE